MGYSAKVLRKGPREADGAAGLRGMDERASCVRGVEFGEMVGPVLW